MKDEAGPVGVPARSGKAPPFILHTSAFILVVFATAGLVGLGVWQLGRLSERRAANAEIRARMAEPPIDLAAASSADLAEFQPARAAGIYDFGQEIVLRNRAHLESPGVRVITPLRLAGSDRAVLIDRGWIPYTQADLPARAAFQAPAGLVTVEGLVRASQHRTYAFLPGDPTLSPALARLDAWNWLDIDQIQAQVRYPLLPIYLQAPPSAGSAALPISGYDFQLTDGPHLSYAIQWFAFAGILLFGSIALWRRSRR